MPPRTTTTGARTPGTQLPYLDAIEFQVDPRRQTPATSAVRTGDIHMMHTSDPQEIVTLRDQAKNGTIQIVEDSGEGEEDFVIVNTAGSGREGPAGAQGDGPGRSTARPTTPSINDGIVEVANGPFKPSVEVVRRRPTTRATTSRRPRQLVDEYTADTGHPPTFTLGTTPTPANDQASQLLQQMFQAGRHEGRHQEDRTEHVHLRRGARQLPGQHLAPVRCRRSRRRRPVVVLGQRRRRRARAASPSTSPATRTRRSTPASTRAASRPTRPPARPAYADRAEAVRRRLPLHLDQPRHLGRRRRPPGARHHQRPAARRRSRRCRSAAPATSAVSSASPRPGSPPDHRAASRPLPTAHRPSRSDQKEPSPMRFVRKKVIQLLLVLLVVTFLSFLMLNLLPGDPAQVVCGISCDQAGLRADPRRSWASTTRSPSGTSNWLKDILTRRHGLVGAQQAAGVRGHQGAPAGHARAADLLAVHRAGRRHPAGPHRRPAIRRHLRPGVDDRGVRAARRCPASWWPSS